MASSSTAPVGPPLQPGSGKELEVPPLAPAASTEANGGHPSSSLRPFQARPVPVRGFLFSRGGLGTGRSSGLEPSVDQAWVPNLDEISELLIQKGDLQAVPINFDFLCACSKELVPLGGPSHPLWRTWLTTWMLPILGEHSFSDIKLSAEEEEVAAALRKRASTRLSGWPAHFSQVDEAAVRRAAFVLYWLSLRSVILLLQGTSLPLGAGSPIYRENFLEQFPDFRANLPLVYRWVGLKTHDHDLVDALDYEENVLFRPYGEDYPGFTCASILRKFYEPFPLIRDLKADDYRSLSYLSTVNPGFLPVLSATGVYFIPYCPQRVQRQFGLDQGVPVGPQETGTCIADLAAFLKSRAFVRWGGETTRDLVIAGRSATTPMSVHRKASVSNPYLAPPSQSAISYANSQKLGFAEWDASRGGWIAYTIHLPEGWRNSVTIVEDRLIMVSKRGQVNKRDAPVDPVFEKTPKKATPSVPSSKKVSSKKAKTVKKSKPPLRRGPPQFLWKNLRVPRVLLVPSAAEGSTTVPLEEPSESTESPPEKARAGKKSKSTVPETSAVKESATASVKGPTESTAAPSKPKSASAGSSQQSSKRIAASRPPKSQKKVDVSSSSPDEEEPSAVPGPSPPKKKKFTAPLFPLGAAGRTRSKSGPKVTHESGRSSGGVVDIEDSDVADDDVIASPVRKDAPQAAAVDQDEDLGKSTAGSSEAGDESMGEEHSSSSASFFDSTPVWGVLAPMEEELAIVPHGDHDDDSAVDTDADPISFSLPQTVLTRAGFDISMAHVMEGVSLFGVTPSLRAIPAGGFVIPASRLSSEDSPVAGGALVPERTPAQSLIESGSVVDLGVDTVSHDAPIEDAGTSAVDASAGSDHLENIGVDDTVHVLEDVGEIGTAGEVTAISPPPRPTNEAGPSVDVGSLSGEVAAFLREFDARAPNPHPEQFFWSFNGPLVPFGDFWVPNDCSPYLSRLSAGHSDFTKGFKLSIGLGGPMMSLLGSVLAAMDESSLEDRLRQMAQHLFGKRLADEIKALQHQIALLQDSLAELTAYQAAMTSTEGVVPRPERGGSLLDSLLD
uniref:Aminotransferase-like plant mobile domain-containing protein n=1 Tax=Fagus sylvatica TaxID=28930 RepID=A0A2N9FLA7_FAGSY